MILFFADAYNLHGPGLSISRPNPSFVEIEFTPASDETTPDTRGISPLVKTLTHPASVVLFSPIVCAIY